MRVHILRLTFGGEETIGGVFSSSDLAHTEGQSWHTDQQQMNASRAHPVAVSYRVTSLLLNEVTF